MNAKTSNYSFRFSPVRRFQRTFISFHYLLLGLGNILYSVASVIRYPSWSETLPLNKQKAAAPVVNSETCCYVAAFLQRSGHLLGSELRGAVVTLELPHPSPSSPSSWCACLYLGLCWEGLGWCQKKPPKTQKNPQTKCCRTCLCLGVKVAMAACQPGVSACRSTAEDWGGAAVTVRDVLPPLFSSARCLTPLW